MPAMCRAAPCLAGQPASRAWQVWEGRAPVHEWSETQGKNSLQSNRLRPPAVGLYRPAADIVKRRDRRDPWYLNSQGHAVLQRESWHAPSTSIADRLSPPVPTGREACERARVRAMPASQGAAAEPPPGGRRQPAPPGGHRQPTSPGGGAAGATRHAAPGAHTQHGEASDCSVGGAGGEESAEMV